MHILRNMVCALALFLSFSVFAAQPVDINTADAKMIAQNIKGIGISKAEAIVAYRTKNGAFNSIDDLVRVKGIGKLTIEKNRTLLRVGSSSLPSK